MEAATSSSNSSSTSSTSSTATTTQQQQPSREDILRALRRAIVAGVTLRPTGGVAARARLRTRYTNDGQDEAADVPLEQALARVCPPQT